MSLVRIINSAELETILQEHPIVLVDFFEHNCGPCKMMKLVLESLAKNYADIVFVALEYTENTAAVEKYSVGNTPYLILFKNGTEAGRLIGLKQKPAIETFIKQQ